MAVIPVMVDFKNKKAIIIGGGKIATRRAETLMKSEADLTVVSPETTLKIQQWHEEGKIEWKKKYFSNEDVVGASLIIIATNDESVNAAIRKAAPETSLINETTNAEDGSVHFPAHFQRGKLSIAVSTNGASPFLAKKVKQELESRYPDHYGEYVDFLYEARQLIKKANLPFEEKERYLKDFLDERYFDRFLQQKTLEQLQSSNT